MAYVCEICGKYTRFGKQYARRGAPKRRGGSGAKISGKTPRTFRPNLQSVRAMVDGRVKKMKVCASCLQAGKVKKAPRGMGRPKASVTP